jgi:hypothetical protein
MRFFEFSNVGTSDKFLLIIKNFIGRAQSKNQPAKLNWATLNSLLDQAGEEAMDYETFKAMYDANPAIQPLIANFNADGIELKVPGVAKEPEQGTSQETPQDQVSQQAAQVAQNQIQA